MNVFKNILIVSLALFFSTTAMSLTSINGAGSTFAEPIYTKWFAEYQKSTKDIQFNYQGIGSGAGIKQLIAGTVDFAGTDDPMSAEDSAKVKSHVLHVPIAMGAVVVTYNLDLKKPLQLSSELVGKIFDGTIKKWNDPAIVALNKDAKIPDMAIVVATRSDGSGTTAVFSDYLAKTSPQWNGKNGKVVKWFEGSLGAKGNAGVAGLVKQNPGTIGYVELVYALENKLSYATLQNKAGKFIQASAKTVSAAALNLKKEALENEFKISITNSAAKDAYPISAFTWLLVVDKMSKEKGTAILNFAKWSLSEKAQGVASEINYAPVPKDLRAEVLKSLAKVTVE